MNYTYKISQSSFVIPDLRGLAQLPSIPFQGFNDNQIDRAASLHREKLETLSPIAAASSFDQYRDARVRNFGIVSSTAALQLAKSWRAEILSSRIRPLVRSGWLTNRASSKRGNPPNRR